MNHLSKYIKPFFLIVVLFGCQSSGTSEKQQVAAIKKDSILSCCQNLPSRFGILKKEDSTIQTVRPKQK